MSHQPRHGRTAPPVPPSGGTSGSTLAGSPARRQQAGRDSFPDRRKLEDAARLSLGNHELDMPHGEGSPVAECLLIGFVIALGLFGVWLVISQ